MLEVIIVMAVIVILAAIATPNILKWLPNIRLKSAARDMYTSMQKAKINAIKENKEWAVVFDPGTNSYKICYDSVDDDWTTTPNLCNETVQLNNYQSGIKFGHGNATTKVDGNPIGGTTISYTNNLVTFNPRGFGNAGYVYLDNQQNTSFAVGTQTSGTIKLLRWKGQWE